MPDEPVTPPAEPPAPTPEPATTPPVAPAEPDGERLPDDHKVVKAMHDYKTQRDDEKQRRTAAEAELEQIKNANLSDTEKAINEAKAAGAAEATKNFGLELAAAKLEAAGVPADKVGDLNLASVLDTEGKVDPTKVAELAARHRATPAPSPGSADGGPQGDTPTPPDLDAQIAAANKAGDADLVIRLNSQKLAASVGQ